MFPDAPLSPLTALDIAVILGLGLALPVHAVVEQRVDRRRRQIAGPVRSRMRLYISALAWLWVTTVSVLACWLLSDRPLAELGLRVPQTAPFIGAMALAVLGCAALAAQVVVVRRSAEAQAEVARQLAAQPRVAETLPVTRLEQMMFRLVSVSAGVGEEVVFRGFLIWGFAHWMPPALAAALSLAIFAVAHVYQESAGALVRVGLTGLVLTALVMISGSLLPAILLHVVVDLSSGEMSNAVRQRASQELAKTFDSGAA